MATYLKARSATAVPMADMRHVPVDAGEIVVLDETNDKFKELWESGDPWMHSLFDETSSTDHAKQEAYVPHEDPVKRAMEEHEELVRARSLLPMEERVGTPDTPIIQTDRFRTLPTSGADLTADHRVARGVEFDAEGKAAEEEKRLGDKAAGDDPDRMIGDQAPRSTAPEGADGDDERIPAKEEVPVGEEPGGTTEEDGTQEGETPKEGEEPGGQQ